MHPQPAAPDLGALAPGFAGRFTMILAGLAALIARAFLRNPRLVPLIVPLCARLNRTARRVAVLITLLARHGAIRHGATRRGEASDRGALAPRNRCRPFAPRTRCPIPTTPAWLIAALRHEAAAYASQLAHLLAEPGISELLDAAPAAKRLLRPLCRMLGISDTPDTPPAGGVARQATGVFAFKNPESVAAPSPDTPPAGGVARLSDRCAPSRTESVAAPLLRPPTMSPPPCPHLRLRWPWFPRASAKIA
jgi:hypothetical protein